MARDGALEAELEFHYEAPISHDSFEKMVERLVGANEDRRPRVEAIREQLRAGFEAAADARDGKYWFYQPCRLNLLRRR